MFNTVRVESISYFNIKYFILILILIKLQYLIEVKCWVLHETDHKYGYQYGEVMSPVRGPGRYTRGKERKKFHGSFSVYRGNNILSKVIF